MRCCSCRLAVQSPQPWRFGSCPARHNSGYEVNEPTAAGTDTPSMTLANGDIMGQASVAFAPTAQINTTNVGQLEPADNQNRRNRRV